MGPVAFDTLTSTLFQALADVEDFSYTTIEEREVIVWGSAVGFLSFILSIIISIILEIKRKALKQES